MNITQEELLKKYEELPEDLKKAMYSASTAEIIYELGKKYGLNIEETGDLTTEVAKIILGLDHPKNFISTLIDILGVPKEKAIEIAQDVNHQIFFPIREELKKLHGIGTSSELTPSAPSELPQREAPLPRPEESVAVKQNIPEPIKPAMPETVNLIKNDAATSPKPEKLQPKEKREIDMPPKEVNEDKYREPID